MPAIVRRWEKRQIAGMARSYKTKGCFSALLPRQTVKTPATQ